MAAALSLLLFLLEPPPSAARLSPNVGKIYRQIVKPIVKEIGTGYLKDTAQQGVQNFPGQQTDPRQLGISAAYSLGAFTFDLSVGTSPQSLPVFVDITSELIWVQCGTPQSTPTFVSRQSDTFVSLGCDSDTCKTMLPGGQCSDSGDNCWYKEVFYGSGQTFGFLANETFTFGTTTFTNVVLGCGTDTSLPDLADAGASGILGFSRGPLSLVSQLQISQFSYFVALPDVSGNVDSFVSWNWGDAAAPAQGSRSTPLVVPTAKQNPYLYYVRLTGVEVDGQVLTEILPGTFDVDADGNGGVVLSTTLPVTYLEQAAYSSLRTKLVNRIQLQGVHPVDSTDFDHLCFSTQSFANVKVPNLALVFTDAVMELAVKNYFFSLPDAGQTCLSILPSKGLSILGSLLQADRTMTYDLYADVGGLLTFETLAEGAPTSAGTPAAAGAPTVAGAPAQAQVPLLIIMATFLVACMC